MWNSCWNLVGGKISERKKILWRHLRTIYGPFTDGIRKKIARLRRHLRTIYGPFTDGIWRHQVLDVSLVQWLASWLRASRLGFDSRSQKCGDMYSPDSINILNPCGWSLCGMECQSFAQECCDIAWVPHECESASRAGTIPVRDHPERWNHPEAVDWMKDPTRWWPPSGGGKE